MLSMMKLQYIAVIDVRDLHIHAVGWYYFSENGS
jgi:hypothetical protein